MSIPEQVYSQPYPLRVVDDSEVEFAITGAVPIVRYAILFKHDPPLTEKQTRAAHDVLKSVWPLWKEQYRAYVAVQAQLSREDLDFAAGDEVRLKKDGKTPMLDLPRIHALRSANLFDMRNCCALCVDKYSSKTWTRVGPTADMEWIALQLDDLRSTVSKYRALAKSCGEWFHGEFERLTSAVLGTSNRGRSFEITTIGLQVAGDLDDYVFDSWLLKEREDGSEGPNFDNATLCRYLAEAASLDYHPSELTSREEKSFWMSIPTAVEQANGDLVSRKVLYMVRPVDEVSAQVVGVGLDDSRARDLAPEVALKVSRLLANRV